MNAQADADSVRLVGESEAAAIEAVGKAEAERMRLKAAAYKQYGDAAILSLVLETMPKIAAEVRCSGVSALRFLFIHVLNSTYTSSCTMDQGELPNGCSLSVDLSCYLLLQSYLPPVDKLAWPSGGSAALASEFPGSIPGHRHVFRAALCVVVVLNCKSQLLISRPQVTAPLSKTEEIVMIGGEDRTTSEVSRLLGGLPPAVSALTGVDLSKVLSQIPGATPAAQA